QRIPRIGKGLIPGKSIKKEKKKVLMEILSDYREKMNKFHCEKNIVVATNALRIAANGKEIANEISEKFSLNVIIVTGEEEAKLSFLGAVSEYNNEKNVVVIDIGGGSTELIFGKGDQIYFKNSFPVGVVSLTEKYLKHDPPLEEEIKKLRFILKTKFSEIPGKNFTPEAAIAIAGTPTTLACIQKRLHEFDEQAIEGSFLQLNELEKLINELSGLKKNKILELYKSVVKGREDVLLAGTIILFEIMNMLKVDKVIVSTKGIRYGAVLGYLIKG
ncbi:MAG TPA: hypothetical protein VMT35_05575, partial [Ignavibacteriaceae bacterium]|nr:hypothetical protein [Ignavibacteriaceae bacterium]